MKMQGAAPGPAAGPEVSHYPMAFVASLRNRLRIQAVPQPGQRIPGDPQDSRLRVDTNVLDCKDPVMSSPAILQVPFEEQEDLLALADEVAEDVELVHPFDGETVAQLALLVSAVTLPFVRAWIKLRIESRKSFVVIHDGHEYRGYTPQEIEQILRMLAAAADADPEADG